MKFIHVSDTHLGCKVPVEFEEKREKDFLDAFKQVVDFAIDNKVDFIIHSGDFFDERYRISIDLLYKITEELVRLKENDIAFIAIKGNHDLKGTRGKAFDQLKISKLILEPKLKNPIEVGDVIIQGFSEPKDFHGKDLTKIYINLFKQIKPKENYFNILLTHTVPDNFGYYEDPRIIPIEYYPKDFDYYALGHFHQVKEPKKFGNGIFVLPGSTERTEISKREVDVEKGFYLVENKRISFIKIKTRKMAIIDYPAFEEEEIENLIEKIISAGKDAILKLRVLLTEKTKDIVDKRILDLKSSGYMIIYEPILESSKIKIDFKESEYQVENFEALIARIIEDELKKFENYDELLDELNKILSIYDEFGGERLKQYVINKIKKPYVSFYFKKTSRQKSLLEWG